MSQIKTILVVEDDALNREILVSILEDTYNTLQAENGRDALDILEENEDKVSLILLDLFMPVMDGYSFLDVVREDETLSLIPVIVTTQEGGTGTEVDALKHGANDFVPKPYSRNVILNRVKNLIKFRENAAFINQINTDRLTGLMSKEYFCVKAEEILMQNPNKEYSVICTDIENFKLFNDLFGYEEGNKLLKRIAGLIQDSVASVGGICGRMQADKFLCMVESEWEKSRRERFTSLLMNEELFSFKNIKMRWGIYEIKDRDIHVDQMCDRAQLAAQSIKGKYDTFYHVYDDTIRDSLVREKNITDAMEKALEDEQFVVYLQPKYELLDNHMIGAEALVRWKHHEWGMVSPGEFIPVFEKNGFIFELDCYIWEKACQILARWIREGRPVVPISVNVSRADLYRKELMDILTGLIEKYDIPYKLLHLEVTESAYADNPKQIMSSVEELRTRGFIIEMDDFGSGYSSLNMLGEMKLDILKLDMGFIRSETEKNLNNSIIGDIVAMAHKLHLKVTAEGVETIDQLQRLKAIGCDVAQGYFFSRPIPVEEFEALAATEAKPQHDAMPVSENPYTNRLSILIADDDFEYAQKLRDVFNDSYSIVHVLDAEGAIDKFKGRREDIRSIAAVIVGSSLPKNGAERVIEYVRHTPAIADTPILLTFSSASKAAGSSKLTKAVNEFICKMHPVGDTKKKITTMVNLNQYRAQINDLKKVAYSDYMTGLYNRRGLDDAILKLSVDDLPLAVCIFDMDNLKEINDYLGHARGDWAIKGFANIIKKNLGDKSIFCRYGGDEIVGVISNFNDREELNRMLENVLHDYTQLFAERNLTIDNIVISCSGGAAIWESRANSYAEIFDRADKALYKAKTTGKNRCFIWDENL